jgi:SAM-dependent methyltransferase
MSPGARPTRQTVAVTPNITYGSSVPGETELRLCGVVDGSKRAVELGVSEWFNSIELARAGAKAIAVDLDPAQIAELRRRADASGVTVQCIEGDIADLGDITSATCDVVVAAHTMLDVDDLGRLLRQVHRILKPSMPFVISMPHPFDGVSTAHPYGTGERTVGDWFTALGRSNFRVDQMRELGVTPTHPVPTTLVLRARKEGS